MNATGNLRKMLVEANDPVDYTLVIGEQQVHLNPLLGTAVRIEFSGNIHCVNCGRKTNKSFNQGYCYPCFRSLAECDQCIMRPELCHYHLGTCRQPDWGKEHCMKPHIVYLSHTSGTKVGITRGSQVPTRWIDQGAVQAIPVFRVQSRFHSGLVEAALKSHIADRTDWRAMLKGNPEHVDMAACRDELLASCGADLAAAQQAAEHAPATVLADADTAVFNYPVERFPTKVVAHNLDKNPVAEGALMGIKGQYLIFDTGVINVRKYGGYEVTFTAG